jgi:hypothetical protein
MLSNSEIWPPSSSTVVLKLNLKSSLEGSLSSDLVEGESREFQAPKWVSYALEGCYKTWGLPYDLYDRELYLSLQGSCISLCTGEDGCEVGYWQNWGCCRLGQSGWSQLQGGIVVVGSMASFSHLMVQSWHVCFHISVTSLENICTIYNKLHYNFFQFILTSFLWVKKKRAKRHALGILLWFGLKVFQGF